ncbi:MAG TPA: DNA primase [Firmicutes bacterium]|nr:DNA primase [Bacillota bacterium]
MFSEVIERVREASDIVTIIGERVALKKQGKNYIGLCPFHQEKTPSFTVSPEKQMFYCFGCQVGGDVFKFVELWEKTDFKGALEILAERAAIPLSPQDPREQKRYREHQTLYQILDLAARFYHHIFLNLPQGREARAYCERRGIDRETGKKFMLGYAPPGWRNLIQFFAKRGFEPEQLVKAGLALPGKRGGYYDRFRNRLLFPIWDQRGRVVAFGGRVLDNSQPKYLNSPETTIYSKGKNLYGLHLAAGAMREQGWVLVVEGYLDALAVHQYGWPNVVASLGTALTYEQARLLGRHCRRVLIAYDADTAGQEATLRGFRLLREAGCQVSVVPLPPGSDPDSYLREKGASAFGRLLEKALPLVEYRLRMLEEQVDLSTLEGKMQATNSLVPLLAEIDNQVERELLVKRIAGALEVSEASLWAEIGQYRSGSRKRGPERDRIAGKRYNIGEDFHIPPKKPKVIPAYLRAQEALLAFCLHDQQARERIMQELSWQQFAAGAHREVARALWLAQAEGQFAPVGILARVEGSEAKALLSRLSLQEEFFLEQKEKGIRDCLAEVKRQQLREEIKVLQEQIISLEGEGKSTEKANLLIELIEEKQKQLHRLE